MMINKNHELFIEKHKFGFLVKKKKLKNEVSEVILNSI